MAYNNGFPMGYPQFYPQQFQQFPQQQPIVPQQQVQQQIMTPPTIHADIIQMESEQAADNYPVAAGTSQMMIKKDDSEIYIKTAFANGQSRLDVYVKRHERPNKPVLDLEGYVTKDELENRLNAILKEVRSNGNVRATRKQTTTGEPTAESAGDKE